MQARALQYNLAGTSNVPIVTGCIPFAAVFRYLGAHMHHSLSDLHDVQHRITSAGAMFGSLKSTLCAHQVNLTLKGKIYQTLVVNTLLYGCEAWALTAETRRMLASFHGRCVIYACVGPGMLLGWMRPGSHGIFAQAGYLQKAAAATL